MVHRVTLTAAQTYSLTNNGDWIITGIVGGGDTVTIAGNGNGCRRSEC